MYSIRNKEELPGEIKLSVIILIYKKGQRNFCNNYRDISLSSTTYKMLFNIVLSRVTLYAKISIGYHQYRFELNISTSDHIICIRQILEKKW